MSRGVESRAGTGYTREEAYQNGDSADFLRNMKLVMDYGIPIVLASGNLGDQEERKVIDNIPQVLEQADFPVINVGATTLEGKPWSKTQGQGTQDDTEEGTKVGTQLTMYAVGVDVQVHNHIDGEAIIDSGTSFAAPVVAGIIAQHMNYLPWDTSKTKRERVKEIKRFIRTPESSWERVKNANPNNEKLKVNMVSTILHVTRDMS
jgi:hypothetical protein